MGSGNSKTIVRYKPNENPLNPVIPSIVLKDIDFSIIIKNIQAIAHEVVAHIRYLQEEAKKTKYFAVFDAASTHPAFEICLVGVSRSAIVNFPTIEEDFFNFGQSSC